MSTLVDATTLPYFTQIDLSPWDGAPTYLDNICSTAHKICAAYLGYEPAAGLHSLERGAVHLNRSGRDMGTTTFRLACMPLWSDDPLAVFSASGAADGSGLLHLTYTAGLPELDVLATIGPGVVPSTDIVRINPVTGRCWIAWMGLGSNWGIGFQYGAGSASGTQTTGATGYKASYVGGYACNAADQSAYPQAPPAPSDMQQAAAWIVEILLGQAGRVKENTQAAINGIVQSVKNMDLEERYHPVEVPTARAQSLLMGSLQGMWARQTLDSYKRTAAEAVLFL